MQRRWIAAVGTAATALLIAGCATTVMGAPERGAAPIVATSSTSSTSSTPSTKDVTRTTTTSKSTTSSTRTTTTRTTTSTTPTTTEPPPPPPSPTPEEEPLLSGQALVDDLRVRPYVFMWTLPPAPAGWVADADSDAFRTTYSVADDGCVVTVQTWKEDYSLPERDFLAEMVTEVLSEVVATPSIQDLPTWWTYMSDGTPVNLNGVWSELPGGQLRVYGVTSGPYGATVMFSCLNDHLPKIDTEIFDYVAQLKLMALPAWDL